MYDILVTANQSEVEYDGFFVVSLLVALFFLCQQILHGTMNRKLCHSSDTLSGMARKDPHWLVPVWCFTGTRKVLACSRKGHSRPAGMEQPRALLASLTKKPPCPHPPSPSFSDHPCVGSLPAHTLRPIPLICGRW